MRKFLRNCTALLLAVAALLWLGGTAYRQTTAYRNLERTEETEKYREMPERIAFAVFGPSHGRDAFQKEDYGEGFFNFSMSSQTPQYDWMQLREFQDRLAPGATVVDSLDDALDLARQEAIPDDGLDRSEIWIIGGGQLFREAMPFADKAYVTQISMHADADTYAPDVKSLVESGAWRGRVAEHAEGFRRYRRIPFHDVCEESRGVTVCIP